MGMKIIREKEVTVNMSRIWTKRSPLLKYFKLYTLDQRLESWKEKRMVCTLKSKIFSIRTILFICLEDICKP